MKSRTTTLLLATAIALAAAGSALAQQAPKPENLIKWRQSAFQVVAWNSGRIKSSLDGGYNKDQVLRSANAIAAIANAGLGSLFAPGTETGKGWHDTSVKAEAFSNQARFAELGGEFAKESNELARVASSGADAAAVKEQFGKLQKACKSCHDDFRNAN
ncbi:MAG TPA: cytochrome c [Burkholderiaceae bacterium]|jgi:cytochrome c556|nr:cytochrome c [Burkholderiaceae bacterium]